MSTEESEASYVSEEAKLHEQLEESVANRLVSSGHKSEAYGCIALAGDMDRAEHTLHLTRNRLDKTDPMHGHYVAFLNASIKIMQKERDKLIQKGLVAWQMSRSKGAKE